MYTHYSDLSPEEAQPFRDLILACPDLLSLELPVPCFNLSMIYELSQARVTSKLRALDIILHPEGHFDLVNLHLVLARFTKLDYLRLYPIKYETSPWSYNPQGRMPQLAVATLVVTLASPVQNVHVGGLSRMLTALIARSSFRSLILQGYTGDSTLPNWLPTCSKLSHLTLWCPGPLDLCRLLLPITKLLPELCSLATLSISSQALYCALCDLPLTAFLQSLPSSIRQAGVKTVAFPHSDLPVVSLADLQPPTDSLAQATVEVVLAELADLANDWLPEPIKLRKSDRSAVGWVIIGYVLRSRIHSRPH